MRVNVGSVASRVVVTAPPAMPAAQAARLMRQEHTGTLVVVAPATVPAKPLGLVTDRDLVMEVLAQGMNPDQVSVGDLPTRPLATVREDDELFYAIDSMRRNGVRRLVVVNAGGDLVGLIAMDDIIGVLAEELTGLSRTIGAEVRTERVQRAAAAAVD
jgi:signal-transduction protein with cAMP-binding, CBS, and nucleotidyltransferase domain